MTTNLSSSSLARLVLVSTGPSAGLAAGTLVQHLGLSHGQAMGVLADAPSVLADAIEAEAARRLADLLRSFGLRVRLDILTGAEACLDLSVQLATSARLQRTLRIVSQQTGVPVDEVAVRLQAPGGLVLEGLARSEVDRLAGVLGRIGTVNLIESDRTAAVYDVFLPDGDMPDALADWLRMIGAEPDPITGAVAAGLDCALCDRLLGRAFAPRPLVLDRAFQRYDLYLTRATGWETQRLTDFLVTRTGRPRSHFDVLAGRLPLRIEAGLAHTAARQFRADYASMGLQTLLVLSGLAQNGENATL